MGLREVSPSPWSPDTKPAHHPGVQAPNLPVILASRHPTYPLPWSLGCKCAHHSSVWAFNVSITPASGHHHHRARVWPSPSYPGTECAHHPGIWALTSKQQACPSNPTPGGQARLVPWHCVLPITPSHGASHSVRAHPGRRAWRCPGPCPAYWSQCRRRLRRPGAAHHAVSGSH